MLFSISVPAAMESLRHLIYLLTLSGYFCQGASFRQLIPLAEQHCCVLLEYILTNSFSVQVYLQVYLGVHVVDKLFLL